MHCRQISLISSLQTHTQIGIPKPMEALGLLLKLPTVLLTVKLKPIMVRVNSWWQAFVEYHFVQRCPDNARECSFTHVNMNFKEMFLFSIKKQSNICIVVSEIHLGTYFLAENLMCISHHSLHYLWSVYAGFWVHEEVMVNKLLLLSSLPRDTL